MTDVVNRSLADKIVGVDPRKHLQVRDLDVPSTDGGKRARQSIVLVPVDGTTDGTAMCGWVDTARREAELRPYEVVSAQHLERYRRPFDVTVADYDAVTAELRELLALDSIEVRVAAAPEVTAPPAPAPPTTSGGAKVALAVAVLAALAALVLAVAR